MHWKPLKLEMDSVLIQMIRQDESTGKKWIKNDRLCILPLLGKVVDIFLVT